MPYTPLTNEAEMLLNKESPTFRRFRIGTWVRGLAAAVVSLTGVETLTNKTLTAPTISGGAITGASITTPAMTGGTAAGTALTSPDTYYSAALHDYDAGVADWVLSDAEAKNRYLVVTNAGGAVNAIIPAASIYKEFAVLNTSGQALTVISAAGTGIVIASTKSAIVYFDGTNVLRLTVDA